MWKESFTEEPNFLRFTSLRAKNAIISFRHILLLKQGVRGTLYFENISQELKCFGLWRAEKANFREVLKNKHRIHLQHTHHTDCSREIRGKCAPVAMFLRFPGAERPAMEGFWNRQDSCLTCLSNLRKWFLVTDVKSTYKHKGQLEVHKVSPLYCCWMLWIKEIH